MPQDWSGGLGEARSGWSSAQALPAIPAPSVAPASLDELIAEGRSTLERCQQVDGHWVFELEADATIPSEYVLLGHYLDEIDQALHERIGVYLRGRQARHGGWALYEGGDFDISASVKAYFALKLIGDAVDAPHMARARKAILRHGGAARVNVFTRITLALFGQVPWRAVPVMPVEIMLLPRWFPFHLEKVSYWSRTVIAPLLILMSLKPKARNPRGVDIRELFRQPPEREPDYIANATGQPLGNLFVQLDRALRLVEPLLPRISREKALQAAVDFIRPRLNGEHGLGGIFPAMANAVMAFDALGYPGDDPDLVTAKRALRRLIVDAGAEAWCQPCLSPVWDTALAAHAMLEAGADPAALRGLDWLAERQITDTFGDWSVRRPGLAPGGWPFEYANDHYPDVDDTAAVVCALHRADPERYRDDIARAVRWVLGMQSADGGWGSFDADNTHDYLNNIPFADHGALLDPPTADLTARCLSMLCQIGYPRRHPAVARALAWLKREQEPDGSWFGRWGTNYIYGTWCALVALNAAGEDPAETCVRRAVAWLKARQQADGGWGESCASYWPERKAQAVESTPSQTAWALLALMAVGEVESDVVARGIAYLCAAPREDGVWSERLYNAVGFPRVFYLHYHGYKAYFPLWALSRYRNLMARNDRRVPWGM